MKRLLLCGALVLGGLLAGPAVQTAEACPMCKENIEADDHQPRAYMLSILFMLGMPFTLLTGFGVGFYVLSQRGHEVAGSGEQFGGSEQAGGDQNA